MFLKTETRKRYFTRPSKLGQPHTYWRHYTVVIFRCDNCNELFERERGRMSPSRLSNHYFHVCPKCDPKRFAQRKGVERRFIWDAPVNSNIDISKI
jgi:hypothetical protein